jgi:hypothetical protein
MKFSDIFKFQVRRKVRNAIWKSEDAMQRIETDILQFKNRLAQYERDPQAELGAISQLQTYIRAMEENLVEFKLNHARFVVEQRTPSAAFPRGIAA